MTPVLVRAVLTVVFAVAGGYCLIHCLACTARAADLLASAAHTLMCAVMLTMLWARPVPDPWGWRLTAFAAAVTWFAARAVREGARLVPGRPATGLVHHALGMAAMFWMLLPQSMAGMPGMPHTPDPTPDRAVSLALAGYLLLAAVWWLTRTRTAPPACQPGSLRSMFGPRAEALCHALMAGGMATALVAMR